MRPPGYKPQPAGKLAKKALKALEELSEHEAAQVLRRFQEIQDFEAVLVNRILERDRTPRGTLALAYGFFPSHAAKLEKRVAIRLLALAGAARRRSRDASQEDDEEDDGQKGDQVEET